MSNIAEIINTICDLTDRFHHVLNTEKLALETQNFNLLEETLDTKHNITIEIEKIQSQLYKTLTSLGLPTTNEGISSLIDKTTSEHLSKKWSKLTEKLLECEHQNKINGTLIISNNNQNSQLLNIITQQENQEIYDSNAKACQASKSTTKRQA